MLCKGTYLFSLIILLFFLLSASSLLSSLPSLLSALLSAFSPLRSPLCLLSSPLSSLPSLLSALLSAFSSLRSPLCLLSSPLSALPLTFPLPPLILSSLLRGGPGVLRGYEHSEQRPLWDGSCSLRNHEDTHQESRESERGLELVRDVQLHVLMRDEKEERKKRARSNKHV